jgi:hypothetical protein
MVVVVIGSVLILAAVLSSLLAASAVRFSSLVSTLLTAYLAFVANLGLVTLVLSPFREVTRGGLAVAEAVLLAAAVAAWAHRGRPLPPLGAARTAFAAISSSPLTLLYLLVVSAGLAYELVLGLTAPPNNYDSLTYHLARVAAWVQHGGIYWIPNAPTDRMNEFQPLAEQQNLFLFVATHRDVLYALPQFLAELAILVSIYGAARRLGFQVRAAACSAFLFATFPLIALEASTAQNDLFVASLPAAAACLLLGSVGVEPLLAGFAAGISIGAKLTALLISPILVWLALARGRKASLIAAGGAVVGFVAIGCWSFVLNEVHTSHLLGHGQGRTEHTVSPSVHGTIVTAFSILYELMDLSVLWRLPIHLLAYVAVIPVGLAGAYALRRTGVRRALLDGSTVALPFIAPALMIVGGTILAFVTRRLGSPVRGSGGTYGELNNSGSEDATAFGPIGGVVLLAIPVLTAGAYFARKVDLRQLALACALPSFLILLSVETKFDPWLPRFLILPAALTAPLFASLFRNRVTTAAFLCVSALLLGLAATRDLMKPLESPYGAPWGISWVQALDETGQPVAATAFAAFEELAPPSACVGAVLNDDNPAYLLYGRHFRRRVVYLPAGNAELAASRASLTYAVIGTGPAEERAVGQFRAARWTIRGLGASAYWTLAVAPSATNGSCA